MFDFLNLALNDNGVIVENKKWVDLSLKFGIFEKFQMVSVQGLGKVSIYLDQCDKLILQEIRDSKNETIESSMRLSDAFTLSYLWVLGAYESIRTISQRLDALEKENNVRYVVTDKIRDVKRLFEEIRIPLAKMEISRKHKNDTSYSPIAYPILDTARGIAWNFGDYKNISRKELSEAFLSLLQYDFTEILGETAK
jgi:hypothetical protein